MNTTPPSSTNVADDSSKVGVVAPDFKERPATETSVQEVFPERDDTYDNFNDSTSSDPLKRKRRKTHRAVDEVKAEGAYIWDTISKYVFRPGVAGGLVGIVNVGLLAGLGRAAYTQPHLLRDRKVVGTAVAATLALTGLEGFAVEQYRKTPAGQAEERKAKEKGTYLYQQLRQQVLRPGVFGGILGLVNLAILGGTGYASYVHWDKPTWDRRIVSAVSAAILAVWGAEGVLAEKFIEHRK